MQMSGSSNRRHLSPSLESRHRTRSKSQSESRSPEEAAPATRKPKTQAPDHAETTARKRDGMRSARSRAVCEQKPENIHQVTYGGWRFDVEHTCSGYAKELIRTRQPGDDCLYVCQKCFKYSMDPEEYCAHQSLQSGQEVPIGTPVHSFGGGRYEIYEVDGANQDHQPFLQRMCLFGKLFIQNKSIWYEFDNFVFYILLERRSVGNEPDFSYCGFFSKEKISYDENNLSCIILYPPYRSQGLGSALIDLSYHISRATGRVGGPEKPGPKRLHKLLDEIYRVFNTGFDHDEKPLST
ncbi:Histone acetyltransferase [Drechslerella dactyloides]|uniref:Histone acetyltransferase n=1 Tax=Drechslerella dactyloides TaxID=74499 RepID=A0AAD6J0J4_DREDA|nr:Histone acetyltransferase [Drechslerella dactyloides]